MSIVRSCQTLHACESMNRIGGVQTFVHEWVDADSSSFCLGLLDLATKVPFNTKKMGLRRSRIESVHKIRSRAGRLHLRCRTMICHNFHGLHALAGLIQYDRLVLYLHTNSEDVWERLERTHHLFDAIIASGQSLADEVRRRVSPSILPVLPLEYPLSHQFFSAGKRKKDGTMIIGYAGRLVIEQKRPERLVPFCRNLGEMGVHYLLEIAGEGPCRHALQKELAGLPVKFLGPLDRKEIMTAYSRWDLQINTSDYETGPLTILEGIAAGVIPILPNIECQARVLLQPSFAGCIYERGNMVDAARQAGKILRQPAHESDKTRLDLKNLAQGRSIKNFLDEIHDFLERIHAVPAIRGPLVFCGSWMDWLPLSIRCKLSQGPEILY